MKTNKIFEKIMDECQKAKCFSQKHPIQTAIRIIGALFIAKKTCEFLWFFYKYSLRSQRSLSDRTV